MSSEETGKPQQRLGSTYRKSVSLWPDNASWFSSTKRERNLAYLTPLYNEKEETIGYRVNDENRCRYDCSTPERLLQVIVDNNFDVYISKLYGRNNGFIWLADFLSREGVTAYIAASSKTLVTLSIKVGRRKYKIINASNWQNGIVPNDDFLVSLRRVFDCYGKGTYASPS